MRLLPFNNFSNSGIANTQPFALPNFQRTGDSSFIPFLNLNYTPIEPITSFDLFPDENEQPKKDDNFFNRGLFGTDYSPECLTFGIGCPDSFIGNIGTNVAYYVKMIAILLLGAILIALGIYALIINSKTAQNTANFIP